MPISTFGTGPDNQRIWLDEIDCEGHESNIALCEHSGWGNQDCSHNEDLALTCSHAIGTSTDNNFMNFEKYKKKSKIYQDSEIICDYSITLGW